MSHTAAEPVEFNDVCLTKLKLPYQTDSDPALLCVLNSSTGFDRHLSGGASGSALNYNVCSSCSINNFCNHLFRYLDLILSVSNDVRTFIKYFRSASKGDCW